MDYQDEVSDSNLIHKRDSHDSRKRKSKQKRDKPSSSSVPLSDQRHIVAIKGDNGDVGFVAVRKLMPENTHHRPKDLPPFSDVVFHEDQAKSSSSTPGHDSFENFERKNTNTQQSCDRFDYDLYGETYCVSDFDLPVNDPRSGSHEINEQNFFPVDSLRHHQFNRYAEPHQLVDSPVPVIKHTSTTPRSLKSPKTGIVNPAYSTIPRKSAVRSSTTEAAVNQHEVGAVSESMTPDYRSTDDELQTDDDMAMDVEISENVEQTKTDITPTVKLPPYCKSCGQNHGVTENHEYDYVEEIDEDLMCDICLQPFVDPYDTKCGHTFCSICIKNYLRVKHMCPVDRQEMENTSADCWQSSLILRKLLNKLIVICPNTKHCSEKIPRCNLEAHLRERCAGHVVRCAKYDCGCAFKAPRAEIAMHEKNCQYKSVKPNTTSTLSNIYEEINIELFRPEGTAELGLLFVGGVDTPVKNIIIQEIVPKSLVEDDSRLHVGDIIVELNGEELYLLRHVDVRVIFTKPTPVMKFKILREKVTTSRNTVLTSPKPLDPPSSETLMVSLIKPPMDQLGIKIAFGKEGDNGVYIVELVEGQVAYADGRLHVGDRILAIGSNDLRNSNPEHAAKVIQSSGERVDIFVTRKTKKISVIENEWAKAKENGVSQPLQKQITAKIAKDKKSLKPLKRQFIKKIVSVTKSQREGLGFIVSGGVNSSKGNLPIFVQDVLPSSILGKDKRVKRGDILVEINGTDLNGLTHSQAMGVLRESVQKREVKLIVIELEYDGMSEDIALWDELTSLHQHPTSWAPSWKMWLYVPNDYRIAKDIFFKKPTILVKGIRIIGGASKKGQQCPVFITQVSTNPMYPISLQNLKCGDEILAINKHIISKLPLSQVIQLFKVENGITLTIVSWPGSLH